MRVGIGIATYHRSNGFSKFYLRRCLVSIINQTWSDWRIYLIGDNYSNEKELLSISRCVDPSKIQITNLDKAVERESLRGDALWCCGGVNAMNTAIDMMQGEVHIYAHLDDDDYWEPNHLSSIVDTYKKFPETSFVFTSSTYHGSVLPSTDIEIGYNNLIPSNGRLIHSSASWKIIDINLRYRNVAEQGRIYPADADMWERISDFYIKNGLKAIYVPKVTVNHDQEGVVLDWTQPQ